MCNWRKWVLPGLLATAILTALAMVFNSGPIERDLAAKAGAALSASHPWASVELDGRDLTLNGVAPDEAAQAAAAGLADAAWDVRKVTNASTLPPVVSPYAFKAAKDAAGITLTGNVPSEAMRAEIVAAAETANPGIAVTDRMTPARGAPEGFGALAAFGLSQLGGFTAGEASLTDNAYSVSGTAADPDAFEVETGRANAELPGGGTLASAAILPPLMADWSWSAAKDAANTVTLAGVAPSLAARDAIAARAAELNPGATINNVMKIAAGAPDGFDNAYGFGLGLLPQLATGAVTVDSNGLSVEGNANGADASAALVAAVAAAPAGLAVNNRVPAIEPGQPGAEGPVASPFVWSAQKTSGNRVEISGFAPSRAVADTILAEARDIFGSGTEVVDALQIAGGAPDGFADAASFGLAITDRLEGGAVTISDASLSFEGETLTEVAREAVLERINTRAPAGFTVEMADLRVKPGPLAPGGIGELSLPLCQDALNTILSSGRIRFATGEATIEEISHGLLDRLAYTAQACPSARVEISGHTDSDGSDEANQLLSERRAQAVRDYLVASGVPVARLDAAGYGETRPIAGNDTDEGKALNRRIEFKIIQ